MRFYHTTYLINKIMPKIKHYKVQNRLTKRLSWAEANIEIFFKLYLL